MVRGRRLGQRLVELPEVSRDALIANDDRVAPS
jgi:hypothetical protein